MYELARTYNIRRCIRDYSSQMIRPITIDDPPASSTLSVLH
jgi:hypothetical protein